jgi:Cu-Zn family superoxide dismutase
MLYSLIFALASFSSLTSSQPIQKAVAVLVPNDMNRIDGLKNVRGKVTFEVIPGAPSIIFQPDVTRISGTIRGLECNKEYGLHVHEFGDISSNDNNRPIDCLSTGNHYDPFNTHFHSDRNTEFGHLGDLGNIKSNKYGVATFDFKDDFITLDGISSVVGRGIVVHERMDDMQQPLGNAGGRPSCGVIAIAQNKKGSPRLIANSESETTEYDQDMEDNDDTTNIPMESTEYDDVESLKRSSPSILSDFAGCIGHSGTFLRDFDDQTHDTCRGGQFGPDWTRDGNPSSIVTFRVNNPFGGNARYLGATIGEFNSNPGNGEQWILGNVARNPTAFTLFNLQRQEFLCTRSRGDTQLIFNADGGHTGCHWFNVRV